MISGPHSDPPENPKKSFANTLGPDLAAVVARGKNISHLHIGRAGVQRNF